MDSTLSLLRARVQSLARELGSHKLWRSGKKKANKTRCEDLFIKFLQVALIKVDTIIAVMNNYALKIYILKFCLFIYLAELGLSCSMWDLIL